MKTISLDGIKIQSGEKIPVFPLPNAILFPHVELPLHVFEARYRKMLEDCQSGSNLMAVSLLKKGWETSVEPLPAHDIVGVGFVKLCVENNDGTSHIIIRGIARARISEYTQWEPYRIASMNPIEENVQNQREVGWKARKLSKLFLEKVYLTTKISDDDLRQLETIEDPGELANLAAFTANVDFYTKQELLETVDLDTRLNRLIEILEQDLIKLKSQK